MTNLTSLRYGAGGPPVGGPPRPATDAVGKVEPVAAGNLRSTAAAPNNADVFNAIVELSARVQQLSKNQQVLDAKLDHITKRIAAVDSNLIRGITYPNRCLFYVEALVAVGGDANHVRAYQPGNLPHWQ